MASKLIIDRIQPDMKLDENGNIVWTPRLIDYNAAAYSRGHIVTPDEFNTELLKQTYQGNYNTDTISVLIGLYNNLKTDVTDKSDAALSKAITAESNSVEALNTANDAYSTSIEALSDVQTAVNASVDAIQAAETATVLSEEAMAIAEDASDRADEAKIEAYEAMRIAEAADDMSVTAEEKAAQALSISQLASSVASSANTKADSAVATVTEAASTANSAKQIAEASAATVAGKASTDYVDSAVATQYNESVKYTDAKVAALIDSAPETLDTFKEIADAFAEDQEVLDTLNAAIGFKADRTELFSGDYNDLSNKPIIPEVNQDTIAFAESERQKSKNLYENGNISGTRYVNTVLKSPLPAGTYTISGILNSSDTDATICRVAFYKDNSVLLAYVNMERDARQGATFTISDTCTHLYVYASSNNTTSSGDTFSFTDIMITSDGSTDYQPYYGEIVHKKDIADLPTEYLKDATVLDDTLTLKKQDGTTLSFTGARQLVGEYTFGSASSFEITGLDLQGDGGVYDIIVEAPITSAQKNFCFRLNNNSATNAYVHSHFDIDPTNKSIIIGEQSDGTGWAYLGAYGPNHNITVMTLMLCQGRPMWVIDTTGYLGRLDFQKFFGYTVTGNVTSMQILASVKISAGLKVKIYRRLS